MLDASVVICAYTLDRWELTKAAVESSRDQTRTPKQVILCIDNNEALLTLALEQWRDSVSPPVKVIPNESVTHLSGRGVHAAAHGELRRFGAGTARNTGLKHVDTSIVAFLDDDARAESNWLEELTAAYNEGVVAVGGAPLPDFEADRPRWFPDCFDWIFGCAYFGMPSKRKPYTRLIGANMSARTSELNSIGGFSGSDFDDLDICTRLEDKFGRGSIVYEPGAIVHHRVPASRLTIRYLLRRSFFVNREKVRVHRRLGSERPLAPELGFALNLLLYVGHEFVRLVRGDIYAPVRIAVAAVSTALAASGNVVGQYRYRWRGLAETP